MSEKMTNIISFRKNRVNKVLKKGNDNNSTEEHISKEDFRLPGTVSEAPPAATEAKLPSVRLSPSEEVP